MDSLELVRDMLKSINACDGLYIEEILCKYKDKCELPFILNVIAESLSAKHICCTVDCANGTKFVITDDGRGFLNTIIDEGRFEKFMNLKKAMLDLLSK